MGEICSRHKEITNLCRIWSVNLNEILVVFDRQHDNKNKQIELLI
jgi:hypothetical protein